MVFELVCAASVWVVILVIWVLVSCYICRCCDLLCFVLHLCWFCVFDVAFCMIWCLYDLGCL